MATEITLRRTSAPGLPPLGLASSLTVQGTWHDLLLLRRRVRLVDVTGLRIIVPPLGSAANHEDFPPGSSADFGGPSAVVEQLSIHDSSLDILRPNGKRYTFPIRLLVIRNLQKGQALSYAVDMQNPKPTGHIFSTGSFGPLNTQSLGATPLSGDFTYAPVNLHDLGSISGTLSSTGHFQGTLAAIEASATSETPDFAVGSGRPTHFTASIQCAINGLNGDVALHDIDAKTRESTIHVQGSVAGSPKVIDVDMAVAGGRVQDVLRPFIQGKIPVAGAVWVQGHARVEPGGKGLKFLQRLRVDGTFNVPAERLTDRATEQKLSAFSERAQGGKAPKTDAAAGDPGAGTADSASGSTTDVLSSLNGQVKIRDGILSTQRMTFDMPGAGADLSGSYNLHDHSVNLVGNLRMQANISHVTTGFKSMLLKPLIPFFKKSKAGAVIPIAVTGRPGGYKVTQNLLHRK
jgi:hypothetical protein